MRIAIVHDYLNQLGGAERIVSALHEIYPEAPIYTSIYDEKKMPKVFQKMDIRTSFMQNFPFVFQLFRYYLLFYPLAFESFDLSEYDLIISSSSAWAKGVKKKQNQIHICYCHTPMRFVWRYEDYVKRENFGPFIKSILPFILDPIKRWDLENTKSVDFFIANSKTVAGRIQKIYGRESVIINPPVDCSFYQPSNVDQDYFLIVSRLNTYKRIDIVVEAFNELELPLKIIGEGPDRRNLEKIAKSNIEFLGRRPDLEVAKHLAQCRAVIFPGEEDFGIVPLEAMASGRPAIAYKAGGAKETIIEGETGILFEKQDTDSLKRALQRFQFEVFDKKRIREHALKYDKEIFKQKIRDFINDKIRNPKS